VILGCLQPGHPSSVYSDALNRLADRLHYLNSSGDKAQDATRFWFDTRANLRREMEDRKRRFDDKTEVRGKIGEALKREAGNATFFDGAHIFTPHGDVPDDTRERSPAWLLKPFWSGCGTTAPSHGIGGIGSCFSPQTTARSPSQ